MDWVQEHQDHQVSYVDCSGLYVIPDEQARLYTLFILIALHGVLLVLMRPSPASQRDSLL